MELMEYAYMLHRSLLERAEGYAEANEVFAARRALLRLQQDMSEASHFGEISDLLDYGWGELKLPELRGRIQEALSLREAETRVSEGRLTARVGQTLTVLFGLAAVPTVAKLVVQPLWALLGFPRPIDAAAFQTIANVLSFVGIGLIVAVLLKPLRFRQRYLAGRDPERR